MLQPSAEEAIESTIKAVLKNNDMESQLGFLFPPVDMRFEKPPTILASSRRNHIQLIDSLLLKHDINIFQRNIIENKLLNDHNLSGFIDDLSGLGTYPTMVSDLYDLRTILEVTAHEWLHCYFIFKPLGISYRNSEEMTTINETIADIAGKELGKYAYDQIRNNHIGFTNDVIPNDNHMDTNYTEFMYETRKNTDKMLATGKVAQAENYMKARLWLLRLGGYNLRKLNQAYFAFRGIYADSPESISPIGDEIHQLRAMFPDVGSFIKAVSNISTYAELQELKLKLESSTDY